MSMPTCDTTTVMDVDFSDRRYEQPTVHCCIIPMRATVGVSRWIEVLVSSDSNVESSSSVTVTILCREFSAAPTHQMV